MNGAPCGSLGLACQRGWMTSVLFIDVLKHIRQHLNCSIEYPILLLLDNHSSHISVEAIVYAKDNGIIMLSFPPHCTHRIQPLDVGIFGPFKSSLKVSYNNFMISNRGRAITIADIPGLSKTPFYNSFTTKNIQSAFQATGIWPVNQQIFKDVDFNPSYTTDRPIPSESGDIQQSKDTTVNENLSTNEIQEDNTDADEASQDIPTPHSEIATESVNIQDNDNIVDIIKSPIKSPEVIRPLKVAVSRKKTKRVAVKSTVYTDTPIKTQLEARDLELKKKKELIQQRKDKKVKFV